MAYNNITSRGDVASLIPEEVSNDFLNNYAPRASAARQLFRPIPVGRAQVRFPVLSALPVAYWVSGDTGLKQTTELSWANKFMNIEELAVIMPVPESVMEDLDQDIWGTAMPLLTEAFGIAVDAAVFFGTNAPASFPTNVLAACAAAGNSVVEGTTAAEGGFFADVDEAIATVESDGYEPTGYVAALSAKAAFRRARGTTGERLDAGRLGADMGTFDGAPITYPMPGMWPTGAGTGVRLFAGDWRQFVMGVRRDITMKILTEAVLQDNTGAIIYNLAQQDLNAIRLTFRVGWQVANTINREQPTEANRYPVAALRTAA
jgi:HK97 family phage major capsid protein